jgi:MEDS: MEthanogen/methylotroph, DcmR Sensory domain
MLHVWKKGPQVQHIVQLFDDSQTLTDGVSEFVEEGLANGDTVLVVMTFGHWQETAAHLVRSGVNLENVIASGQLSFHDAAQTMSKFMRQGRPRRSLFQDTVGALVHTLAARGKPLRIYGEMVDLLAREADFNAALQLEEMWNDLAAQAPFTLFCGYSAVNFGNPLTTGVLRRICQTHSQVRSNSRDLLASYLVSSASAAPEVA